jgi:RNA polymerase sigma-70 factor (ECF subfamily)
MEDSSKNALPAPAPSSQEAQEREIVRAAQRGDRAAFEAIVQRYQSCIFGYLRARLIQRSDAEDLMQEVFLRFYLGRARFDTSALVRPWLIGIARNLLREYLRSNDRRRKKETAWTELCLEIEQTVAGGDARYDDAMQHLPACLEGLGRTAREAIDLHYAANLRLADIAERLRRSAGAVKLLLFRARQALRYCLEGKASRA